MKQAVQWESKRFFFVAHINVFCRFFQQTKSTKSSNTAPKGSIIIIVTMQPGVLTEAATWLQNLGRSGTGHRRRSDAPRGGFQESRSELPWFKNGKFRICDQNLRIRFWETALLAVSFGKWCTKCCDLMIWLNKSSKFRSEMVDLVRRQWAFGGSPEFWDIQLALLWPLGSLFLDLRTAQFNSTINLLVLYAVHETFKMAAFFQIQWPSLGFLSR